MAGWTVAVLGPGGVGGLVGGLLARAGHDVVCVAGPETAAALRAGLTVRSAAYGDFTAPVRADVELREPVDACLVTVKATALDAALARVPPDAVRDRIVVSLLNGVEHMAVLRERYPAARVVAGAIRVESTRTAPGVIAHTSPFASVELAGPGADVDRLATVLREAGLDVSVRADEAAMLWDKLAFLAPLALLTTSAGAPAGAVRADRAALTAVIGEVAAVANAEGAAVDPAAVLAMFDRVPAGMKSSMQRDAEAGRALELDAIGGAVLRAAARHGIAVPRTATLVAGLERLQ